jgi:hypothetical protein
MNSIRISSMVFFICILGLAAGSVNAQSVSMLPLTKTSFCAGDSISVSFTVSGVFGPGNAFILQLSDTTGSFTNGFQSLGTLFDTLPGTFVITTAIIGDVFSSARYRLRIIAANPYFYNPNNTIRITIGTGPGGFYFNNYQTGGVKGTSITFTASTESLHYSGDMQDIAYWDFGSGATPAKATTTFIEDHVLGFSQDATYSTTGDKTVTLTIVSPSGCSDNSQTYNLHIYDCTFPSVPPDAIVIDSNATAEPNKTYWVNPGFTLKLNDRDTIFAEPGSTISERGVNYSVLYMKHGSVLNLPKGGLNSVIFGDGASINTSSNDVFTLNCPNLDFDYTNAPPNKTVLGGVHEDITTAPITLSPNPTRGIVSVDNAPLNLLNVSVINVLGVIQTEIAKPNASNFQIDLTTLPSGTYYVRFVMPGMVVTKKIIRE